LDKPSAERNKSLSASNFFGRSDAITPLNGVDSGVLCATFRMHFEVLAKAFRPRKPYVVLNTSVTFTTDQPMLLSTPSV
jgi:hypothetical protein